MTLSLLGPIVLVLFLLALVGSVIWVSTRGLWSKTSLRGLIIAVVPGLVMVGSFYALALHMYVSLGGWPKTIGETGFPPALLVHARVTLSYFGAMALLAIFGWPIALLTCSLVRRLRRYIAYVTAGGVAFVVCLILMMIGPSGFLYWWWD
ncbi:hypothetical protein LCGC14_2878980 [marine sediment metagenome]|uniref:Uncharacterized protein n=1 Tax=marine sediment metagenome TaxID=412755 RepID=A0A0F8Y0Y5_9ZZZZ